LSELSSGALINYPEEIECAYQPFDGSPVVYERPARSVPGFALITAPVITSLFTGRDAEITMNSVKTEITQ